MTYRMSSLECPHDLISRHNLPCIMHQKMKRHIIKFSSPKFGSANSYKITRAKKVLWKKSKLVSYFTHQLINRIKIIEIKLYKKYSFIYNTLKTSTCLRSILYYFEVSLFDIVIIITKGRKSIHS